ncbi:MAG: SusC/RagA family TonB-linked outer membrane protein [Flavobacteriaceae bacterium]|nr:SusC/RagA family TonB-linked outer membrane protein [Flavobacteriaceae bacterium]MDG2387522.1 SusC/RagA family TonB-linked outer membrane protein [Flavobacteriaceae bacterium]
MKKEFLKKISLVFAFFVTVGMYAQTVTGLVTSEDGPLPGATVQVKGTAIGVSTDFDGNFTIQADNTDVLMVSFVGFTSQEIAIGDQDQITVTLVADNELEEVIVTGYGSQKEKEITSAVVKVTAEEFNKGPINDATQLLQGKVAGLSIYNKGGNPNAPATIRLRGLSTVGANVSPLVVVDGVVGASLDNVDPNDIESINVLKDGSAAAIYGSRGSSGVIIVTTKGGKSGEVSLTYNGQLASASILNRIDVMNPDEFRAAGGSDLGGETDWTEAVTRNAISQIHNISASGGFGNTTFRVSANVRENEGIVINTGFEQFNSRANISTRALDDKLKVDFNASFTQRSSSFGESLVLKYATLFNPTAPIYTEGSEYFPGNSGDAIGGYFETFGLFDSYNPVSIAEQHERTGERTELNYNLSVGYDFSDNFDVQFRAARQTSLNNNRRYVPVTALLAGNALSPTRRGLADFNDNRYEFKLYEAFANYNITSDGFNVNLTGGYSFQQDNFTSKAFGLGDFPGNNMDYSYNIDASEDLLKAGFITANSSRGPDNKIIAFFGRANVVIDDAIYVNASVRREGSTKLGDGNKWGTFPAFGIGADLNKYIGTEYDLFKIRVGYGETGSLPGGSGLSQVVYNFNYDSGGSGNTSQARAANPDLKWESKAETNIGLDFAQGKLSGSLDVYTRDISDFILETRVDVATYGFDRRFENSGKINTQGLELNIGYQFTDNYQTNINLSTYNTTLEEYVIEDGDITGNLGSPGQNSTNMILIRPGEAIGQIWAPRFDGVNADGSNNFGDVNNDGLITASQDKWNDENADFISAGNGIPTLELGWSNNVNIGNWSVNAFFRGAFGHSLVNTFRAFYEPRLASQSSYNFVNTELALPELTVAQFSSLYVEKADFFKLDNLTVAYNFNLSESSIIEGAQISANVQNAFVITNYTGIDPEPALVDGGFNGAGFSPAGNVLAPGIDRRDNYFTARTVTIGLNINF